MKLRNDKLKIIFKILLAIIIIYIYITIFINNNIHEYIEKDIKDRYSFDINIKDNLLYTSLNKIVSFDDLDNINNIKNVSKIIEEKPTIKKELKPIIYIYNTHDTEKYSLPYTSDYSIIPDVKLASYILKDHLNDLNVGSIVEDKKISTYLKKHNLNYYGCYRASRSYMKDRMKKNEFKILIDLHRDSVKRKYTVYEKGNKKYAKVMFVLAMKHKNYKKNLKFINYIESKINKDYKGLSRGIMKRKDEVFNQDLSDNAILIELGGVGNTIEELNNTLEVISKILNDYIKEKGL